MTGKNAARNNEMVVLVIAIALVALEVADKAMAAVDAWGLAQAVAENDQEKVEAKALEIGVGLATDAVPGSVVTIKIGKLLRGFGAATNGAKVVAKAGGKIDSVVGKALGKDGVQQLLRAEEKYGERLWTKGGQLIVVAQMQSGIGASTGVNFRK